MSDRPTEPFSPTDAEQGEQPARSLSEILSELAMLSHAQQGEASEMRSAVSELSRALARLFEMIRTDRHDQRARIAELERELAAARDQLAALGIEAVIPPAPNDFDQLRAAAERLRVRTEQLVRESTPPFAQAPAAEEPATGQPVAAEEPATEEPVSVADAVEVVESAPADEPVTRDEPETAELPPSVSPPEEPEVPTEADLTELPPVGLGLRVLPGAGARKREQASDVEVESELPLAANEAAEAAPTALAAALPVPTPPDPETRDGGGITAESEPSMAEPEPEPEVATPAVTERATAARETSRPEPIAIAPHPERKRGLRPRRRRIDARKLVDVEPAAALGSMVAAVNQLWTAGCSIDLVIAFTDGGALRVAGGDRVPLRVEEVEPGTPARSTITATRRQLIPLLGRLELTDEESAPLIHGSRRDADLLVGWFDRAQRLAVQPL